MCVKTMTSLLLLLLQLSSPAYTIQSKGSFTETKTLTPGPLDYHPTDENKTKSIKSYTFGYGNRTPFIVKTDTPPPNKYTVPTTIGNNVRYMFLINHM